MTNPFDELNIQLPGRMIALEVLITMLLREKSTKRKILAEADAIIDSLEVQIAQERGEGDRDYAMKIFAAARASLDNIRGQTLVK